MNKLKDRLKSLPTAPGVYFYKSADGEVIYVGKAANLKNRVRQYFQSSKNIDAKTLALVSEIAAMDWIETDSEIDALFLESEMIKRYKPRFNILLRDDKSQSYVRINLKEALPFVSFTRQPLSDGAEYIGPFYSVRAVKSALRILRKIFPYYDKPSLPKKAGLNFQLGLTPGIEAGASNLQEYRRSLRQLISYIKGNRVAVIREIEKAMKEAARHQQYEEAAHYRNQLLNLKELGKQIVFGREEFLEISKDQGLSGLRDLLGLDKTPRRIESYDISHISGVNNVAAMVVFTNGVADKLNYCKFKLASGRNDDFGQMAETLERRLKHLKDWGRPDLVIIDGGKGQLSAVAALLKDAQIPYIGRNKSGDHSRNAAVKVVIPQGDKYQEVWLDGKNHVAKLIARLDEEAHRFAINYHTNLRRSGQTKNRLEEIPGIGPSSRQKLMRRFGSVAAVRQATISEIAEQIGPAKAKLVKSHLDPDSSNRVETV